MKALVLAGAALSLLALGAHFYRDRTWPLVVACVVLLGLLAWRRAWVPRVIQAALALGTVEWLWTAAVFAQERMAMGRPWTRLAVILAAVALVSAASAWGMGRLLPWYSRASRHDAD